MSIRCSLGLHDYKEVRSLRKNDRNEWVVQDDAKTKCVRCGKPL